MRRKRFRHRLTAALLTAVTAFCFGAVPLPESTTFAADADKGARVVVDVNSGDNRKASYDKNAENWNVVNGVESSEFTHADVTYTLLSNSTSGTLRSVNCKTLQLQSGIYPYKTMDGVTTDDGGTLKLEIKGLSEGTHSLKMWHSCVDDADNSTLSVSINGSVIDEDVECPTRVKSEDDAGLSYGAFEVAKGETVTVLITPNGDNGTTNNAWLNAFELDGADPFNGISRISPADGNKHWNKEDKLSWTAGNNAVEHNVYIGTDYNTVFNADTTSSVFRGTQTTTEFALDEGVSSLNTYYWRVDEVTADGTITKGAVYSFMVNRLAFPSAEGFGRFARGGRGGKIVEVTNLNDSGEGSLRQALEVEKGSRIVVFRVGGVIELQSALVIPEDGGDVYVAGQTAPGDGITLTHYDFGGLGASDVIIRDVRVRVGDSNGQSTGGMGLGSCNQSIVDHCSISWATDEGFSSRSAQNITFQWNIIGESLHDSVHYGDNHSGTETHAFAASISGYTGSFHHNLLIDCTGRNWSLAGALEQDAKTYGGQLDIRNNVVYNWMDRTTDGGVRRLNFIGNYYKAGPVSDESLHIVSMDGNELNTDDMQKMYVFGNKMVGRDGTVLLETTDDAWAEGRAKSGGKNSTDADVRSDTEFFGNTYVETQTADEAYESVLENVGAGGTSPEGRDYIDSRYIHEVTDGTYTYTGSKQGLSGIIDSQEDAGGYPDFEETRVADDFDTDKDGMPDEWEDLHGLDPENPDDGSIVSLSADDYTNVEMYLNELAGDTVEYNGNATEPLNGNLIKNLVVADTANAADWHIVENIATDSLVYGDREVTVTRIPQFLTGGEYIQTACDSKSYTGELATFTAGDDITLTVALDTRVTTPPSWLESWTALGKSIVTSNGVTFTLYQKRFAAGDSGTLGTNGQSSGCVGYFVLARRTERVTLVAGDLDDSGALNALDLAKMRNMLLSGGTLSDINRTQADLNGDGNCNLSDTLLLQNYLMSKSSGFAVGATISYEM